MHPQFADWYRLASVDVNDIDLKARWVGVQAAVESFLPSDLLDAARVFYGLPPKTTDFLDRFRQHFKDADDKFRMLDNTAEVRVLSGAALVGLFDVSDHWGNAAALAVTCPSFRGTRPSAVGDIERLAREALASHSASLRQPKDVAGIGQDLVATTQTHVTNLLTAVKANTSLNAAHDQFEQVLGDVVSGFTRISECIRTDRRERAMRSEESNVLWWLFGGYSRDLNVAFAKIKAPALVMVAGKEMADLTSTIPGAYSARAFLDKAIRENLQRDTASLADVVNACPPEWRREVVARGKIHAVEDLCPTLFAMHKADEADGKRAWIKVFQTATQLRPAEQLDPVDLAEQTFEEWLLARAVAELEKE